LELSKPAQIWSGLQKTQPFTCQWLWCNSGALYW